MPHEVLNAKHHKREAEIVAQAGRLGAVTIATNMAGRGTDIVLGGNPETMAWAQLQDRYETRLDVPRSEWDQLVAEISAREKMAEEGQMVKSLGGLHVIGTERHEARRIDLQLRGRTGRQGDPGSSRFFLCLEDDLMRIFAGEWVKSILTRLGMQRGEAIESRMVTRRIEAAQKKVEERNFEVRKNLLEYDEVMDQQRKRVYSYRQEILEGIICKDLIRQMIERQVKHHFTHFLGRDYGLAVYAEWAGKRLATQLEAKDFRGLDATAAQQQALDEAERVAETMVLDAIEENLPDEEDEADWNWDALAKFSNSRWGTNFQGRDLKREGRDGVDQLLLDRCRDAMQKIDLSEGARFLREDFGLLSACAWMKHKFGIDLDFDEAGGLELKSLIALATEKAQQTYEEKEAEYPVMAGLYRFSARTSSGPGRLDRESLLDWAKQRFDVDLSLDDLKNKQREEIRELLVKHSQAHQQQADKMLAMARQQVAGVFGEAGQGLPAGVAGDGNGRPTGR